MLNVLLLFLLLVLLPLLLIYRYNDPNYARAAPYHRGRLLLATENTIERSH